MVERHLRKYAVEDVHQAAEPEPEPPVAQLDAAPKPRRTPRPKAVPRHCGFCEQLDARLYLLPASPPERRPQDMLVCRFCYLRLAGVVPHRSQLAPPDGVPASIKPERAADPAYAGGRPAKAAGGSLQADTGAG